MTKVKAWVRLVKIKWLRSKSKKTFSQIDNHEEIDWDHRPFF